MASLNKKFKQSIKDLKYEDKETFHAIDEYVEVVKHLSGKNVLTDKELTITYGCFHDNLSEYDAVEHITFS